MQKIEILKLLKCLHLCIFICERKHTGGLSHVSEGKNQLDERKKGVIFKNSASFTDCLNELNNIQKLNIKDLDIVMTMYNRTEYIHGENLFQYYRILHQSNPR